MSEHVLEPLWRRLDAAPDHPVLHWRDHRGRADGDLTVAELVAGFGSVARHLRERGLEPGDRVLLVYPPSLEFIIAFGGCLWAGIIPVPTYPPQPGASIDEQRLAALAEVAECRLALTSRRFRWLRRLGLWARALWGRGRGPEPLQWWLTDGLRGRIDDVTAPHGCTAPTDALLQFTSGSTARPKGVRITHGNLVHQLAFNRESLFLGPDSRAVLWVPQYHDLGLISGIISALVGNGEAWLMSPLTFLRDPGLWFDVMSEVRGTHTAAPNFAFDYLLRRTDPSRRARWDLSSVRVIMSAAEPIIPATVRRFLDALAPSGLRQESFCPAYGLAEHTVGVCVWGRGTLTVDRETLEQRGRAVSHHEASSQERETVELSACGVPSSDIAITIVDPEDPRELGPAEVGEIWVDSPSKAAGYWGGSMTDDLTFAARLPGDPRRWLRTGDQGFLHDSQLYLTGRLKDLIIIGGRNIAPEDIERSVRDDPRVRPGGLAAFALRDDDDERIGLVVELDPRAVAGSPETLARELLRQVHACWPLPTRIALVAPKSIRKTTSGKVRRSATRAALLAGELLTLACVDSPRLPS